MKIGSFCSGYGGLEVAVEAITGGHTVWQSETDPHASTVLGKHWPGVPNHGDLTTFDWSLAEPVDVVTAGYPCQPFSTAGRRGGENDARHIWPHILRAVRILGPRLVLLENVSGHLSLGFGQVLGDLAEARYVGSWRCLRAADVGAPHRRERVFIFAHAADAFGVAVQLRRGPAPVGSPPPAATGETHERQRGGNPAGGGGQTPSDTEHNGWDDDQVGRGVSPSEDEGRLLELEGCATADFGPYQPAIDRWANILGRPAPPGLRDGRLNERFVEWMMGLPDGWVTDLVPRRHALRILGNGVVPQQAEAAYRALLSVKQWEVAS